MHDSKIAASRSDSPTSLCAFWCCEHSVMSKRIIYWPVMSHEIKQFIETCDVCRAYDKRQPRETLISHEVPDRRWVKVGIDLFSYRSRNYLICVDYYSSFSRLIFLRTHGQQQ